MTNIPRQILLSAAAAAALLVAVNLWLWPNYPLRFSSTTFGVNKNGYKAAYLLLSEMGFPAARSYFPLKTISVKKTLWFVSPFFLDPDDTAGGRNAAEAVKWVRSGATAVVFGEPGSDWKRLGLKSFTMPSGASAAEVLARVLEDHKRSNLSSGETVAIGGDWTRKPRTIMAPGLLHFQPGGDHADVRLRADGAPFAIELKLGAGRLIAVADDRFFRNVNLENGDDSVLLAGLAVALGPPVFDERCHALAPPSSIFSAIAFSRAVLPLLIGLIAVLLWAAERRTWPMRTLPAPAESVPPSIVPFVESLGALYARASDPKAAFDAYRAGFLLRLRWRISPHSELTERGLIEKIARDRSIPDATRRWLTGNERPRTESELLRAANAIELFPRVRP